MQIKKSKGFTIIELLVVVAIISVLTGIVLVNVTKYIDKGKDAAAKADLSTLLVGGAIYYDTNGNYVNWITGAGTGADDYVKVYNALTATNMGYTVTANCDTTNCAIGATKWCAQVPLKYTANTYCVDSTGNKLDKASGTCGTTGVCL